MAVVMQIRSCLETAAVAVMGHGRAGADDEMGFEITLGAGIRHGVNKGNHQHPALPGKNRDRTLTCLNHYRRR